jgi:hypothetical protein
MFMASSALRAALTAGALALAAGSAAATPGPSAQKCFFITAWQGWKSPSPNVLYLRVNRDIYRVGLSVGSDYLRAPGMRLISKLSGSTSICNPLDLSLVLTDGRSFRQGLIAETIAKLTPDEAAAIPPKDRP